MIRATLSVLTVLAFAAPASAAPKTARDYFSSATSHYNLSEWQAALDDFREAYRLKPDPAFLFNIAQCERQLGHYRDAANFYRAYRREGGTNDVERLIKEMDDAAAAAAAQREREAAAARAQPVTPAPKVVSPPPSTARAAAVPPRGRAKLWAGIGVGAAGIVAVAAGAGLFAAGASAFDAIDHPRSGYTFNPSDEDRAHTWRPAGAALIGVGAAMVVTGAALALFWKHESRRSVAIVPALAPRVAGALAQVVF